MSYHRALLVALGLFVVAGASLPSCSSDSRVGLSGGCTINSDCSSPYICAFARCHAQCSQSRDCSDGERCVVSQVGGVCQQSAESTCRGGSLCGNGEVCGDDKECRVQCASSTDCAKGDYCLRAGAADACFSPTSTADQPALVAAGVLSLDGAAPGDASAVVLGTGGTGGTSAGNGGAGGSRSGTGGSSADAATAGGGASNDGGGGPSNACPSAQTQFGFVMKGDANPNFTSGVAVRRPSDVLIFSAYQDASAAGVDGGTGNALFGQSFDPATGKSTSKAVSVYDTVAGLRMFVFAGAGAPTGEVAVVYGYGCQPSNCETLPFSQYGNDNYLGSALHVAFFRSPSDATAPGVVLERDVVIESFGFMGQPHVTWSPSSKAFVVSWASYQSFLVASVQKFLASGAAAGGNTNVVPSGDPAGRIEGEDVGQAGVGVAGSEYGVAFRSVDNRAAFTILDDRGNQVGQTLTPLFGTVNPSFVTVAGTSQGFVYIEDTGAGVAGTFVPLSGGVPVISEDGGVLASPHFTFTGGIRAIDATALGDFGGVGGAGVAIYYPNGVSFAYVDPDGTVSAQPNRVLPHTATGFDEYSASTVGGSFALGLYDSVAHYTMTAASGCL